MPRQTRASNGPSNPYPSHLPASMAPSSMYNTQPRMTMPTNDFFGMPSTASNPMQMAPQPHPHHHHHQQQPSMSSRSFDYSGHTGSSGAAVSLPPPPVVSLPPSHRPSSGAWTPQDDQQLMAARAQGLNWSQIKETYFPTKTANACRKRHERLAERRDADDWDNRKFQRLAKEYMAMRKEIWSGLAARTGDKWNVVEQKCMSNGLKNLQSASRAASRHDRLQSQSAAAAAAMAVSTSGGGGGPSLSGYDDDSGISGIGLTPVDELDASYSSPETSSSSNGSGYHHAHHGGHPHHHPHAHQQLHPHMHFPPAAHANQYLGSYGIPTVSAPGPPGTHHRYSSSVSSTASVNGYHGSGGSGGGGGSSSQGSSPYMPGQRLPSVDMGIGSIINRGGL